MRLELLIAGLMVAAIASDATAASDVCAIPAEGAGNMPADVARATREMTNPQWLTVPDASTLARLYPPKAIRRNVSGSALVECRVQLDQTLTDCKVLEETPPGYGFGQATIQFLRKARIRPRMVDGVPCDNGLTCYPMEWRLG